MVTTFDRTKELMEQIESYKQHVSSDVPISLGQYDKQFHVECSDCRESFMDTILEEAIKKITHRPKCRFLLDKTPDGLDKWNRWFKILWPKELQITKKERIFSDKHNKSSK